MLTITEVEKTIAKCHMRWQVAPILDTCDAGMKCTPTAVCIISSRQITLVVAEICDPATCVGMIEVSYAIATPRDFMTTHSHSIHHNIEANTQVPITVLNEVHRHVTHNAGLQCR